MIRHKTPKNSAPRPLSPHLSVYRPQITSVMSITHRITGIILVLGSILLVGWLLALASGPEAFEGYSECMTSFIGYIIMLGWSAAFYYHLCNGLRHLMWDIGSGMDDMEQVRRSGMITLACAGGLTLITWIMMIF